MRFDKIHQPTFFIAAIIALCGHGCIVYYFFSTATVPNKISRPRSPIIVNQVALQPVIAKQTLRSSTKNATTKKSPPKPAEPKKNPQKLVQKKVERIDCSDLKKELASLDKQMQAQQIEPIPEIQLKPLTAYHQMEPVVESMSEVSFESSLVACMQDNLKLPCSGRVKVEVVLQHDGTIKSWHITDSSNVENRLYIENNFAKVVFPRFTDEFIQYMEYTFLLTLNTN